MMSYKVAAAVAIFLVLIDVSFEANGVHKTQDLSGKEQDKKSHDKAAGKEDHHRYEDWGMDWSDADMMQHPIDEAPRRVSCETSTAFSASSFA